MTSGESIIQELNEQNITLFPLTFDKYGSMGPLATSYFLNSDNVPSITDPKILSKLPKPALINYQKARRNTRMRSLFKSANIGWKLLNKDKWFGSTYQLTTPSNWGKHYLAMNLNIAIVKHIKKSFKIVDKSTNVQAENKNYKILGRQSIANQTNEPSHRKTKSNSITKKITKTIPKKATKESILVKPFSAFFLSVSMSPLSKNNISTDPNRSTHTTYSHTHACKPTYQLFHASTPKYLVVSL